MSLTCTFTTLLGTILTVILIAIVVKIEEAGLCKGGPLFAGIGMADDKNYRSTRVHIRGVYPDKGRAQCKLYNRSSNAVWK